MEDDAPPKTPLLDEWRAEVGDEVVVATVEEARRNIAEGNTPGFTDKDRFLEHLRRPHRHMA
jgi:hypothetical protein